MPYRRRIERLEYQQRVAELAAEAGAPYGFTGEQVLEEARNLLALPPEAGRRELEALQRALDRQEAP